MHTIVETPGGKLRGRVAEGDRRIRCDERACGCDAWRLGVLGHGRRVRLAKYNPIRRPTMHFDSTSQVVNDPLRATLALWGEGGGGCAP